MNKSLVLRLVLSICLLSACSEVIGQESLSGRWDLCFKNNKFRQGPITDKVDGMVLRFKNSYFTHRFYVITMTFRFNFGGGNGRPKLREEDKTIFKETKVKESGIYKTEGNQLILITGSGQDTLQYKLEDGLLTLIRKPKYSENEPEVLIFKRRQLLF